MKLKMPPVTASLGFGIAGKTKLPAARNDEPQVQPERKARVMVVDGDADSRRLMTTRLSMANYEVDSACGAQAALDACVRTRPNLVITDLHLADSDGLTLLKELKSRWPAVSVVILTAHGTIPDAVEATQCGAFGFLIKPVAKAELLGQVSRAVAASTFTFVEGDWRSQIVSRSQLMEDRLELANRAAGSNTSVLMTGENGTGKELLARAIHAASARRARPFVAVCCRNPVEQTLGRQLFGDRAQDRAEGSHSSSGALAAARGGTLLLDEVGDLRPDLQMDLMSALTQTPAADVRLICTTSRDLRKQMEAGEFRQDLYYHINILPIEIPPLGRRREDIPLLVSHFLGRAKPDGAVKKSYSAEAIELLATTDWPGNVRQLFDLVKQNVALSQGRVISKEVVQQSLGREPTKVPTYDEAREEFSRDYLRTNLTSTAGNVSQSARLAKRNRTDFYKLLARYRLHADDFKTAAAHTNRAMAVED